MQVRLEQLRESEHNALHKINQYIDWELFRPQIEEIRNKDRKSHAGRKPYDAVLMLKILILQALYNLSDPQTEYQIRDRISFMDFLGLSIGDRVPDEKTIWLFREQLTESELIDSIFERFLEFLNESGFAPQKGQIVDASIIPVPIQRNSREENRVIKEGGTPEGWDDTPNKKRQKDVDARWTKKRGVTYYGYKHHVNIDVKYKFVRRFEVTNAAIHDSQVIRDLIDPQNSNKDFYGDAAFHSEEIAEWLKENGYRNRIHKKAHRNKPLSDRDKEANRKKSQTRCRVEHTFGIQSQMGGGKGLRCIGESRAYTNIGLRDLSYNVNRYGTLMEQMSG